MKYEICLTCHQKPAIYGQFCWKCDSELRPVRGVEAGDSHAPRPQSRASAVAQAEFYTHALIGCLIGGRS